jgi:hypothetical protein
MNATGIDRRWNLSIAKQQQQQGVKPPQISPSAEDIIAVVDGAAGPALAVVAFKNRTRFVHGDDPNRLTQLKTMMRAGGLPMGCIIDCGDELRAFRLPPFQDDEEVADFLTEVGKELGARMEREGEV